MRRRRDRRSVLMYTHCKNCETELSGMYCPKCGQYALDVNQTFWQYIRQFVENTYSYDGRLMATFRALFTAPGKLTNEFMAGKINSYMQPLKLYMFTSVVFFTFILMLVGPNDAGNAEVEKKTAYHSVIDNSISVLLKDTVLIDLYNNQVEMNEMFNPVNGNLISRLTASSNNKLESKQAKDSIKKLVDKQKIDIFKERMMGELQSKVPIVMMLFIPLYALIVRFQYRKSRKRYLNCFVFALHNSTMLLIFMSVSILLQAATNKMNFNAELFLYLLLLLYMIVSARNVFGTTWFRSSLKTLLGFHFYMLICTVMLFVYMVYRIFSIYSNDTSVMVLKSLEGLGV